MTREAKVGLMMVAVLVGVFGFLVYKRIHRPAEALADARVLDEDRALADNTEVPRQLDDELIPRPKKSRLGRDVERVERTVGKAAKDVEKFAESVEKMAIDTVDDFNPLPERKKPKKPKLPKELPADEDDFAQFETRRSTVKQVAAESPEPVEEEIAFDEPRKERAPLPPSKTQAQEKDPFDDDIAEAVQPVEFTDLPRRERPVPVPNDMPQRRTTGRPAEIVEVEIDVEEPRRARPSNIGFDQPAREKRQPAPIGFADDTGFSDATSRPARLVEGEKYVIEPNDNFWSISRKRYGAGRYYMALAKHNERVISDPRMMKPGVIISTPDVSFLEQRYSDVIPKAGPGDPGTTTTTASRKSANAEPAGYFVGNDGSPMYRIGDQDTLTGIAKSHLGRTSRWVQILEMNRNVLRDGNELKIGTVLRLPADASRVQIVGTIREYR